MKPYWKSDLLLALLGRRRQRLAALAAYSDFKQFLEEAAEAPLLDFDYAHRDVLYRRVYEHLGDGPIDYLEFGVYEGWSIRQWASLSDNADSRFVGFDSFEGLPEAWHEGRPAGAFAVGGVPPEEDDPRIRFVVGPFRDTLPGFLRDFDPKHPLVGHLDADLYSSTLTALVHLDPILAPGSVLVFDEFNDLAHEFAAWRDYARACGRRGRVLCARRDHRQLALELRGPGPG